MADVFICYHMRDEASARGLRTHLEKVGYSCWMAPDDLTGSGSWPQQILDAIAGCGVVVVLISESANASGHLANEVCVAHDRGKLLLPVRLEHVTTSPVPMQYLLSTSHWVDAFPGPIEDHVGAIAESLRIVAGRLGAEGEAPPAAASPAPRGRGLREAMSSLFGAGARRRRKGHATSEGPGADPPAAITGETAPVAPREPLAEAPADEPPGPATSHEALSPHQPSRRVAPDPSTVARDAQAVDCSVFSPPRVAQAEAFLLQVHLHAPEQADPVADEARAFDADASKRGYCSLAVPLMSGSRVSLMVSARDLEILDEQPAKTVIWQGRPVYAAFEVRVPEEARPAKYIGTVLVFVDGQPVGEVKFSIDVVRERVQAGTAGQQLAPNGIDARHFGSVFASYASADRSEVAKRLQMLSALDRPFFQDVLELRPGDDWERRIQGSIDACDLFLLFWSSAAKESEWVSREIQMALGRKRSAESDPEFAPPEILPVAIEGPPIPEPPPELAHLHFGDPLLWQIA